MLSLVELIKVHLTPKIFFRAKKSSSFGEYFFEEIVWFGEILNFLCPVEVEFLVFFRRSKQTKLH